jgi:predicted dehydrogenase
VLRFFPEYAALREIIQSGQIGDPAVLRLRRVVCSPGAPGDWYWDLEASGGCVFDTAIHDLDWLLWTLGRPETVFGLGQRDASKLRDFALLTLSWGSGVLTHLESSWCHDRFATSFEVTGSEGLVEYDMDDATPIRVVPLGGVASGAGQVVPESPLAKSPYQSELEHFIDVIQGRAEPVITPSEAREAVELAEICLKAVKARAPQALPNLKRAVKAAPGKKKLAALPAAHPE